jgi:hypothetical protein
MGNPDDEDHQTIVIDPVQHTVVANTEAPDSSLA